MMGISSFGLICNFYNLHRECESWIIGRLDEKNVICNLHRVIERWVVIQFVVRVEFMICIE